MRNSRSGAVQPCRQTGVGLIELMVALVLGLFLIFGAVTIYQQSRTAFRTTEAVARLQEVGRLAMDVIESDVRMASYWGLNNRAEYIVNRASSGQALPAPFTIAQGAIIDTCGGNGSNWVIDLDRYIVGSNNGYTLTCATVPAGTAMTGADTLTIRRAADATPATLDADRIYLQTSRIQGTMFVPPAGCTSPFDPTCIPPAYTPPASQSRELIVHAYYVSTQSTLRTDVPSLRRKSFADVNSAADAITDDEIVPGVEDLQVRFGVDTNGDTSVDSYVNPNAVPAGADVISATIWLRIRAEEPEVGFKNGKSYQYADMAAAFTPNDGYRRILVTKTIQLRNTRV